MEPMDALKVWEAKEKRQITDLWVAGKLWDLYEGNPVNPQDFFKNIQLVCAVGAEISHNNLLIANAALAGKVKKKATAILDQRKEKLTAKGKRNIDQVNSVLTAIGKNKENVKPFIQQKKGDGGGEKENDYEALENAGFYKVIESSFGFLDCFNDSDGNLISKKPNVNGFAKLLIRMKDNPGEYFTDMGKVGGYLRFHAELSEKLCELIPKYWKFSDGYTAYQALKRDESNDLDKNAFFAILYREYKMRLAYQSKFTIKEIEQREENKSKGIIQQPGSYYLKKQGPKQHGFIEYSQRSRVERLPPPDANDENNPVKVKIPKYLRILVKKPSHFKNDDDYNWQSGITRWKQRKWDKMRIISELYGLPPGATISGTTADHLFAINEILEKCTAEQNKENGKIAVKGTTYEQIRAFIAGNLPLLHLIPLIQMVAQMHHSLAETAAVLSFNGLIKYHIGYYKSLLPSSDGYNGNYKRIFYEANALFEFADKQVTHMYVNNEAALSSSKYQGYKLAKIYETNPYKKDNNHYEQARFTADTADKNFTKNTFYERTKDFKDNDASSSAAKNELDRAYHKKTD